METNSSQPTELFNKILLGMAKASRKLVEESAINDRSLVISIDGEVKLIPARDLLSKVSGKS
jgi:hypothetical protein